MSDWQALLHQDQTDWLLKSGSPSIRYFARRDLLGMDERSPELLQLQDDISASPIVNMLFEGQQEGGYWYHPDKYRSEVKFYGTAWRFMLLAEFGVAGSDPRVRKTAEYLLWRAQDPPSGGFKSHVLQHGENTGLPLNPCFNGMLLWSFIRFGYLAGAGLATLIVGYLWGLQFPVIKKIWTSTYVLVAGGYSLLLLAFFYQIIDVWRRQKWAMPFVWVGTNAITLYLAVNFIGFKYLSSLLVGGPVEHALKRSGEVILMAVAVLLVWGLGHFLYRRKIFIRL